MVKEMFHWVVPSLQEVGHGNAWINMFKAENQRKDAVHWKTLHNVMQTEINAAPEMVLVMLHVH